MNNKKIKFIKKNKLMILLNNNNTLNYMIIKLLKNQKILLKS